jgi:hypothetical protein
LIPLCLPECMIDEAAEVGHLNQLRNALIFRNPAELVQLLCMPPWPLHKKCKSKRHVVMNNAMWVVASIPEVDDRMEFLRHLEPAPRDRFLKIEMLNLYLEIVEKYNDLSVRHKLVIKGFAEANFGLPNARRVLSAIAEPEELRHLFERMSKADRDLRCEGLSELLRSLKMRSEWDQRKYIPYLRLKEFAHCAGVSTFLEEIERRRNDCARYPLTLNLKVLQDEEVVATGQTVDVSLWGCWCCLDKPLLDPNREYAVVLDRPGDYPSLMRINKATILRNESGQFRVEIYSPDTTPIPNLLQGMAICFSQCDAGSRETLKQILNEPH